MRYKLTAGLLAGLLLVSPLTVCADDVPGLQWTLEDGTLTVTGEGEIKSADWREHASEITRIVLGEGITGAKANTLSGYENLQSITLPAGFTALLPNAFADDPALSEIIGIGHVEEFGFQCLTGTPYIAENPFVITDGRLYYAECSDLNVPEGVTEIMPFAFGNLTGDAFLHYEDGVYSAVPVCVTLPEGVEIIRESAFAFCAGMTEIRLPDSLREIGSHAFYDCAHLGSVTLGEHVETVGEQAFFNCKSLEVLTVLNPETQFGDKAYGTSLDWYRAMENRAAEQLLSPEEAEEAYAKTRAALEVNPLAMDEAMASFVVHFPKTRRYSAINLANNLYIRSMSKADFSVTAGVLSGHIGSTAQNFAHDNGIVFVPLDGAPLPGDVNLDGIVDIMDVIRLNRFILGNAPLTERALQAGDFNADGRTDETDSLAILRYMIDLS